MTLITPAYLEQQKQLHAVGNYGISSDKWATTVLQLAHMYGCKDILDYGSGKGLLKEAIGDIVREYDPCIPGKDANPAPADMVVCTDVLEHIEPDLLDEVLAHLCSKVRKVMFLTIAMYPANKRLADGRNAHLILKNDAWWKAKLEPHVKIDQWDIMDFQGPEVVAIARSKAQAPAQRGIAPNKRRQLSKVQKKRFEAFFNDLRAGSRRYSDPLCAVETFEFWEGDDDKVADVQVVIDCLEHQWDVHAALKDIKSYARFSALFCIRRDFRGMDYWRDIIGQHFDVTETEEDEKIISIVGSVRTMLPGMIKVKAAGTDENRWENIKTACATYTDFVQEAPAHERKAIIGCYGPSLMETWPQLFGEAQELGADVVSVSGSHDFLISKSITPRFHIECDPRPHKADNIAHVHFGTEYLLSSTCHPKLFEKLSAGYIRLWHSASSDEARRIRDELHSTAPFIAGGASVGLRAIPVMFRMGYRRMSIYGMDCSFSDDGEMKWAGPHAQKENYKELTLIRVRYNGRIFTTTTVLLSYGRDFYDMVNRLLRADPSLAFSMHGDGLLQARVHGPEAPIEIIPDQEEAA